MKGSEHAEWLDRNGKKQIAPVTAGRNGVPRVRIEARTYTAIYRDGKGITREHATGYRAKRSAETVLAKLEQEAEKVRSGILSSTESEITKHQHTPLSEHIESYINYKTARGINSQRVKNTRSRLLRVSSECNMHRLSDLTAYAAESDPLAAVRALNARAEPNGSALLVLQNYHRFMQSSEVVQALARQVVAGKLNRTFVIVLSPLVDIPVELEKLFVVIEHELPGRHQLADIARGIATEEGELPQGPELERVLDAAGGLTRYEAENAFSLSLVRQNAIRPDAIWQLKAGMLKKSDLLQLHRGNEHFDDLGGLDALKAFCLRAMRNRGQRTIRLGDARSGDGARRSCGRRCNAQLLPVNIITFAEEIHYH